MRSFLVSFIELSFPLMVVADDVFLLLVQGLNLICEVVQDIKGIYQFKRYMMFNLEAHRCCRNFLRKVKSHT